MILLRNLFHRKPPSMMFIFTRLVFCLLSTHCLILNFKMLPSVSLLQLQPSAIWHTYNTTYEYECILYFLPLLVELYLNPKRIEAKQCPIDKRMYEFERTLCGGPLYHSQRTSIECIILVSVFPLLLFLQSTYCIR